MQQYFASLPAEELSEHIDKIMDDWNNQASANGIKSLYQRLYYTYFGRHWKATTGNQDSDIARVGQQGELSALTVNDFRNIIKHMLVLTTNQKISYEPQATNTDESSLTQTRIAKIVLDYIVREKKVDRYLHDCAEMSLALSKAFIKCTWDKQLGRPWTTETDPDGTERILYEGDPKIEIKDPFQVFVDQNCESWDAINYTIDITWVNRWDYIARFPEYRDKILALETKDQFDGIGFWNTMQDAQCDLIALKEFYHKRTPAMPNGRFLASLGPGIVVEDGPIPYRRLPIFRMVPGKWWGSTEGYSESRDLLGLTQAQNTLWSSAFTNQSTFAVQNVLLPEGCNLTPMQIAQGLRVLKYNPAAGKPEALQLTDTPAELFKFAEMIGSKMETIFGLNSISRGVAEDLSGKAMGLLQATSIQYASAFQASYAETAEDLGTFLLHLVQDFAKTERIATVAGKFNRSDMTKFTGESISDINRVTVNLQNPYMATLAGKKEIADQLLANGMIKDPQQYTTFIETGNFDVLTQFEESKLSMIRQENENMMDGRFENVIAIVGEPHLLHMQEHFAILSRPDIKANSQLTGGVLEHINQHKFLRQTQDPMFTELSGEPPYIPPMPMMPPGMPPPPPPMDGAPLPPPGPQQGEPTPMMQGEVPPLPNPEQALQQSLQ